MTTYRFVRYPDARLVDDDGRQLKHLICGDWVKILDDSDPERARVYCRGEEGWLGRDDLQAERCLEIVFLDVGQGDSALVVTPDDRHLLVDGGISDNMYRFLRWRYAGFKRKWRFDAAFLTHPDQDHYAGFRPLFDHENVFFNSVYHNGIMERPGARSRSLGGTRSIGGRRHLDEAIWTDAALREHLGDDANVGRKRYPGLLQDAVQSGRVDAFAGLGVDAGDPAPVFVPGYGPDSGCRLRVLGPLTVQDDGTQVLPVFGRTPTSRSLDVGKTKNGNSLVIMLEYRGLRVLLGGDLNRSAEAHLLAHYSGLDHRYPWTSHEEDEIVAAARPTFQCDVAKSCHHGAADVTDAMLRCINPVATVVSSGDEESHAHPRPETLGAIGKFGRGPRPLLFSTELMRSTREDEGDARIEIGRLRARRDAAGTAAERDEIERQLEAITDELAKRNVTTYGAINLRSDGERVLLAYKLEKPRRFGRSLTEWDTYRLERAGAGPFRHVDA